MIETHVRSKLQPFFDLLGKILIRFRLSPNVITIIAFFTGLASGLLICCGQLFFALLLLWVSGLCDILDGTVARLLDSAQTVGAFIDLISDRMVEGAVILGFALCYPEFYIAYLLFLIAVLLHFSTFVAAGALFPNLGKKSMHYDHSIVERAEAFAVFTLMLIFPEHTTLILIPFNVLIVYDAVTRFGRVLRFAQK